MTPPKGYADSPAWAAFELWLIANYEETDEEASGLFWECFLAGFEVGKIEAAE